MSEGKMQYVDSLNLLLPFLIGLTIFAGVTAVFEATIGPALTYGGDLCTDTENIAAVCGVPPLGMAVALGIAVIGAHAINQHLHRKLKGVADKHGSLACRLLGHKWDLEPPWSGKELLHRPQCNRCGHEPEEIAITGSHEGDHRV